MPGQPVDRVVTEPVGVTELPGTRIDAGLIFITSGRPAGVRGRFAASQPADGCGGGGGGGQRCTQPGSKAGEQRKTREQPAAKEAC